MGYRFRVSVHILRAGICKQKLKT